MPRVPGQLMAQQIYLVRHGETALNADGRLRGLADPDLNDTGRQQALLLAASLIGVNPSVVVSSPLLRAVRTATVIAQHAGVAHQVDDRFNDRDYGRWTGTRKSDVLAQWGSVDAAPGVEPTDKVLSRARPALEEWADRADAQHQPVIVVTHDAVIRPLLTGITPTLLPPAVPTGSYQVLRRDHRTWHVELTDQLPPLR